MSLRGMLKPAILLCLTVLISAQAAIALPTGITGSMVDEGCICHGGGVASDQVLLTLEGLPDQWLPGESFELELRVVSTDVAATPSVARGGFNLRVNQGVLASLDETTQVEGEELTHTEIGNGFRSWNFTWTAVASGSGLLEIRAAVNTVDGDGQADADDHWVITTWTIQGPAVEPPVQEVTVGTGARFYWAALASFFVAVLIILFKPEGGSKHERKAAEQRGREL